jgi:hypothetical protein
MVVQLIVKMQINDCPFRPGKRYEVRTEIKELGHSFTVGEIVVFSSWAYDPHNGVSRFWFTKEGSNETDAWHVWDTSPPACDQWGAYFRELC